MFKATAGWIAKLVAAGTVAVAGLMAAGVAQAHGGVSLSVGIGVPGVVVGAPVYASPTGLYGASPPRVLRTAPTRVLRTTPGLRPCTGLRGARLWLLPRRPPLLEWTPGSSPPLRSLSWPSRRRSGFAPTIQSGCLCSRFLYAASPGHRVRLAARAERRSHNACRSEAIQAMEQSP